MAFSLSASSPLSFQSAMHLPHHILFLSFPHPILFLSASHSFPIRIPFFSFPRPILFLSASHSFSFRITFFSFPHPILFLSASHSFPIRISFFFFPHHILFLSASLSFPFLSFLSYCLSCTFHPLCLPISACDYIMFIAILLLLKGQCHEIFCFWFFSYISCSPAPEYPIRTILNFFENSRRYSQVKVCHRYKRQICHRCQRHRRQVLRPVSLVLLIPVANLHPVSTILVAICHWYQRTGGKFAFLHLPPVSTTTAANLELRISPRIFEKIWNGLMVYSGAWGNLIHEKSQKSKILWHCPFQPNLFSIFSLCFRKPLKNLIKLIPDTIDWWGNTQVLNFCELHCASI